MTDAPLAIARRSRRRRPCSSSLAVFAPLVLQRVLSSALLTQALWLGIAAASLIFLSAYGGMVSLAQVAIYGVAGFTLGNLTTDGNTKGLNLGWAEVPGIVVALARRPRWSRSSSARWPAAATASTS